MMNAIRPLFALAFALAVPMGAWASDLAGQWNLNVEDQNHNVVASLVIEFTSLTAPSCIAGTWSRVKVVSASTKDTQFYPVSEPLSFKLETGRLTIGRNEVCDGYLMLSGSFDGAVVQGDYYSLGIDGSSPLGFFTLHKKR